MFKTFICSLQLYRCCILGKMMYYYEGHIMQTFFGPFNIARIMKAAPHISIHKLRGHLYTHCVDILIFRAKTLQSWILQFIHIFCEDKQLYTCCEDNFGSWHDWIKKTKWTLEVMHTGPTSETAADNRSAILKVDKECAPLSCGTNVFNCFKS